MSPPGGSGHAHLGVEGLVVPEEELLAHRALAVPDPDGDLVDGEDLAGRRGGAALAVRMFAAWLSPSRGQSWFENTSKSSASKASRFARSSAVRFTGNGGLGTPPSAGSGIGAEPSAGLPGPGIIARVRPDCTAPRASTPSARVQYGKKGRRNEQSARRPATRNPARSGSLHDEQRSLCPARHIPPKETAAGQV